MQKTILFDLDGTLTDSSEGITKCVRLALEHFGITGYELSQLQCFIGPPLRMTFPKFGVPEDRVEEAIEVFRSRYNTVGKFENHPYDGILELLQQLKARGYFLAVATSKPESTALQVLDRFELSRYFDAICGATEDGSRDTKSQVISWLLSAWKPDGPILMVGDTSFDVTGAAAFGIPSVGVSWGFDTDESMLTAGALSIAHSTDELLASIEDYFANSCGGKNL